MKRFRLPGNDFYKMFGCRRIWFAVHMIGLFFLICSCSAVPGPISEQSDTGDTAETSRKQTTAAHLKIISRGFKKQDHKKPYLYIRYIQYSIDGKLLEAHNVTKDFERTVDLAPGRHFLHVERLQRGILSARALILDEGDCYAVTLADEQSGVFEGVALPDLQWETNGFTSVESWEKMEDSSLCAD
ncbi:MAG: hypothetical protein C4522_09495 [Desulfobacteraceae bacterium]|nr:MAG: hypothetical protein C4522_09495 [Desulfobacteraceae bacterium]